MAAPRKPRSTNSAKSGSTGRARGGATRSARTRKASTPERASDGRFKPDHHVRNAAFGATAALGVVAAGVAAAFRFGLLDRFLPNREGHEAEDLLIDAPEQRGNEADTYQPSRRAPKAFRPDMDAPMTAAEREALRPAEGHAPAFVEDRGTILA